MLTSGISRRYAAQLKAYRECQLLKVRDIVQPRPPQVLSGVADNTDVAARKKATRDDDGAHVLHKVRGGLHPQEVEEAGVVSGDGIGSNRKGSAVGVDLREMEFGGLGNSLLMAMGPIRAPPIANADLRRQGM